MCDLYFNKGLLKEWMNKNQAPLTPRGGGQMSPTPGKVLLGLLSSLCKVPSSVALSTLHEPLWPFI